MCKLKTCHCGGDCLPVVRSRADGAMQRNGRRAIRYVTTRHSCLLCNAVVHTARVYAVPAQPVIVREYRPQRDHYEVLLNGHLVGICPPSFFEAERYANQIIADCRRDSLTFRDIEREYTDACEYTAQTEAAQLADELRDAQHAAMLAAFRNAATARAIFERLDDADDLEFEVVTKEAA